MTSRPKRPRTATPPNLFFVSGPKLHGIGLQQPNFVSAEAGVQGSIRGAGVLLVGKEVAVNP